MGTLGPHLTGGGGQCWPLSPDGGGVVDSPEHLLNSGRTMVHEALSLRGGSRSLTNCCFLLPTPFPPQGKACTGCSVPQAPCFWLRGGFALGGGVWRSQARARCPALLRGTLQKPGSRAPPVSRGHTGVTGATGRGSSHCTPTSPGSAPSSPLPALFLSCELWEGTGCQGGGGSVAVTQSPQKVLWDPP